MIMLDRGFTANLLLLTNAVSIRTLMFEKEGFLYAEGLERKEPRN